MAAKNQPKVSARIIAKARQVLEFAQQRAAKAKNWIELSNALYGLDGKATELFPIEAEQAAFLRAEEYKHILALMNTLPHPNKSQIQEAVSYPTATISVRLPRTVHAALLADAKAEGVSLKQLCVARLVAQLRAVI